MDQQVLERVKRTLNETHKWPTVFMFKFIVPSENEKIAEVEALFESETAEIRLKQSSNGKYTSITAREVMVDAQSVLDCYAKAANIESLIAL